MRDFRFGYAGKREKAFVLERAEIGGMNLETGFERRLYLQVQGAMALLYIPHVQAKTDLRVDLEEARFTERLS
ncbi:MAG TPA: hypothetical protein VFU86_11645 [Terriglobales bacterium]|nr:hypothetical protein [Terriglobales bacterium]